MPEAPPRGGLFASLKGLLATAVDLLRNRLELLAVEVQEEKLRLLSIAAWGLAAVLLLCAGLVFFAVFITVLFWDSNRLLVLGLVTAGVFLCGLGALGLAWRAAHRGSRLFEASLAELRRDRQALEPEAGEAP